MPDVIAACRSVWRLGPAALFAAFFDILIALQLLTLLALVFTGGFDWGWASAHRGATKKVMAMLKF